MSNHHVGNNGRSNGSSDSSLQNNNPNPVAQAAGTQSTGPDPAAVTASVKAFVGMASSLGLGDVESKQSRLLLIPDGIVPDSLTDAALEAAETYPDLVEKHFDVAKVEGARTSLLALRKVASAARGFLRQVEDDILRQRVVVGRESRALYRYFTAIAPEPMGAPIRGSLDRMTESMAKGAAGTSPRAMAKALKEAKATIAKGAPAPGVSAPSTSPPPTEGTK